LLRAPVPYRSAILGRIRPILVGRAVDLATANHLHDDSQVQADASLVQHGPAPASSASLRLGQHRAGRDTARATTRTPAVRLPAYRRALRPSPSSDTADAGTRTPDAPHRTLDTRTARRPHRTLDIGRRTGHWTPSRGHRTPGHWTPDGRSGRGRGQGDQARPAPGHPGLPPPSGGLPGR
jgi:hypothetical protein